MKKFAKFCVTGGINTFVDFLVFTVLLKLLGANVYVAQGIGFACGTLNSYIINRSWTFSTKQSFFSTQLLKFLMTNLITLCISLVAMNRLIVWLPTTDEIILKLPIIVLTTCINFILSKLWVFN
ncbi:MAG: GtrA family protein [Hydrogenoanaerobacterium sp.]